jgi:predicted dinucleotide-binding enzyme
MNITIVGSGNVGRALAGGWKKAGHSVTFAARSGRQQGGGIEEGRLCGDAAGRCGKIS